MKSRPHGVALACAALAVMSLQGATAAYGASDRVISLDIQELIAQPDYATKVPGDIKFFYGSQPAKVVKTFETVKITRKSSKKHSNPQGSCRWAMYGALIGLAEEARLLGGNAVVNIRSNFDNVETSSETSYKCGIGNVMVGVALTGDVVVVE